MNHVARGNFGKPQITNNNVAHNTRQRIFCSAANWARLSCGLLIYKLDADSTDDTWIIRYLRNAVTVFYTDTADISTTFCESYLSVLSSRLYGYMVVVKVNLNKHICIPHQSYFNLIWKFGWITAFFFNAHSLHKFALLVFFY